MCESEREEIWRNLEFFVHALADSHSRYLQLNSSCFCVDIGSISASDNWLYYPERSINPDEISRAVDFFAAENREFVMPIYSEHDESGLEFLSEYDLQHAGNLLAMSFACSSKKSSELDSRLEFEIARDNSDLGIWLETSLLGFGVASSELGLFSDGYANLLEAFRNNPGNLLPVIAREKISGEYLGSFLIASSENLTGIYYFSVLPEHRRKGVARAMMNFALKISGESGKILLQATPSGIPFYRSFGFRDLFEIELYSNGDDVF